MSAVASAPLAKPLDPPLLALKNKKHLSEFRWLYISLWILLE